MGISGFTVFAIVAFSPFSDSVSITFNENVYGRRGAHTYSVKRQSSYAHQEAIHLGQGYERILTSLEFFRNGVHVDFRYNETETSTGGGGGGGSYSLSVPGCPKSVEGRAWIYYGSPRRCYLVGFQGPCSFGKRLFRVQNSALGLCNCDCFANKDTVQPPHENEIDSELRGLGAYRRLMRRPRPHFTYHPVQMNGTRLSPSPQFVSFERAEAASSSSSSPAPQLVFQMQDESDFEIEKRIMNSKGGETESKPRYDSCYSPSFRRRVLYDSERKQCYPVLEQGPCADKEHWLIRNTHTMGLECEKRKCAPVTGYEHIANFGGAFTYFDYRRQECLTEQYGSLRESSYSHSGIGVRSNLCRDAGMKYSQTLKTCIRDLSSTLDFKAIG